MCFADTTPGPPVTPPGPPVTPPSPSVTPTGPSVTPSRPPKDCTEAFARGETTSGVYTVQPLDDEGPIVVYCDMETDGGGWTVCISNKSNA